MTKSNETMVNGGDTLSFTEDEMIEMWSTRMRLSAYTAGGAVVRADGLNIDKYLAERIRDWYSQLLVTAPLYMLPVEDVTDGTEAIIDGSSLVARVALPVDAVRPTLVQLSSWSGVVTQFHHPADTVARRQRYDLLRAGAVSPVAVWKPGELTLYSAASKDDKLSALQCVIRPPQGTYTLKEAALATIPTSV